MFAWLHRLFEPQVRIRTEWRVMNAEERRAFDHAFAQMDKAFDAMREAFKSVDR